MKYKVGDLVEIGYRVVGVVVDVSHGSTQPVYGIEIDGRIEVGIHEHQIMFAHSINLQALVGDLAKI